MTRPSKREIERAVDRIVTAEDAEESGMSSTIVYTTDDPEVYETDAGERVELEDVDTSPYGTVIILDGEYVAPDARADF
jgi:hypothetical protein